MATIQVLKSNKGGVKICRDGFLKRTYTYTAPDAALESPMQRRALCIVWANTIVVTPDAVYYTWR